MKKKILIPLLGALSCFPLLGEEHDEPTLREEMSELWMEMKERLTTKPGWWKDVEAMKRKYWDDEPELLMEHFEELLSHEEQGEFMSGVREMVENFRVERMADAIRSEKDPKKKSELLKALRDKLSEMLEQRLIHREAELKALEQEIAQLKRGIEAARSNPDRYIDRKLNDLLGDEMDPFEW